MGDRRTDPLRVDFDRQIKLEFHGSTVTSDAGLLAYRELDDALALTTTAANTLLDSRTGQNSQHTLAALLRQSIYSRLAGYEDINDAERLRLDPAMRAIVGGRAKDSTAASTSEMARFETETLSTRKNLKHLMDLPGAWIDHAHRHRKLTKLILDMDSSVSETYGQQEGTAYNGHFECTCYHPLFLFNQFGDLERAMLRRGNHASAKFWRRVLRPVIERYRDHDIPKFFRGVGLGLTKSRTPIESAGVFCALVVSLVSAATLFAAAFAAATFVLEAGGGMNIPHFNLFEKAQLTAYNMYCFCFKIPCASGEEDRLYLLWNKDKSFESLQILWWKIQGLQNEEQIWKVLDAYLNFYTDTGLPRDYFKSKMLRKKMQIL